jgi:phosphatidylserine synthase
MISGWRWAANLATLGNALCGAGAIGYTLGGNKLFALFLILAGMAFDGMDGLFSRRSGLQSGVFGRVVDSLADALTFCGAPAVLLALNTYDRSLWAPYDPLAYGVAATVASLGVFRLIHYTRTAYDQPHFQGASTPQNALLLVFLIPLFQVPGFLGEQPLWLLGIALAFAPLMVLPIPYPKIRRGVSTRSLTAAISLLAAVSLLILVFSPSRGSIPYLTAAGTTLAGFGLLLVLYAVAPLSVHRKRALYVAA